MKKIVAMVCLLLAICSAAFAEDGNTMEVAKDYQAVLGGDNAVVELTDRQVMVAVANLKIYDKMNAVILPNGLKNYMVVRAGNEQAFLIMPHYARTRLTVSDAETRQKKGSFKGELEGRSIVLFCNKGKAMVDMLVRGTNGIQLINFVPEAEDLQENGRPGAMLIPERKQRFVKDVTAQVSHNGDIIHVKE